MDMFPPTREMYNYFIRYAKHFNLYKYINFHCRVVEVDFAGEKEGKQLFKVKWENEEKNVK